MPQHSSTLPVAVIGAGPVGLAAAAHLAERRLPTVIFEAGASVGAAMRAWSHVRVFSPWGFNVDAAAARLLDAGGWKAPDADSLPTGGDIVERYLEPLAAHPAIAGGLHLGRRVTSLSRAGFDKVTSGERASAPFRVRWRDEQGRSGEILARAVIDASGTWWQPNPAGPEGLPAPGEGETAGRLAYGIPDVLGAARGDYIGRRVLVIGGGHSAMNAVLDLLQLQAADPATRIVWALRRDNLAKLAGGGQRDRLPARGALGLAAARAVESGRLEILAPFSVGEFETGGEQVKVRGLVAGRAVDLAAERVVVATGFRPDLSIFRELRVALDPVLEAPPALAPLIDPNLHSCGTVPPHGAAELEHPEPGFYIVGAKSYGRAPTFLMATGYEQVRSIVAEIAGDLVAAREVRLVLPETGVCTAPALPVACCGASAAAPALS